MNRNTLKGMAIMLAIVLLISGVVSFAQAIQAQLSNVSVFIDGEKLDLKDAKGNPLQPIAYNGSIYLPVRAISTAVGKPITWEGKTKSVYIGKAKDATLPALWLFSDWDNIYTWKGDDWDKESEYKDNLGKVYNANNSRYYGRGTSYEVWVLFNSNGNYSKITGTFARFFKYRSSDSAVTFTIYGDDNILYQTKLEKGTPPQDFNVDIEGYMQVKLELKGNRYDDIYKCFLGDVGLWP